MSELVVGVFASGERLLAAARAARERGLQVRDVFTPFPVHGMDEALGLGRSRLSSACLALGLAGLTLGFGFQEWVFLVSWPMNIGGKPLNAWPAYIPVSFELTVLFAGVGSILVFLYWRSLWPLKQPSLAPLGAADDKFILALTSGAQEQTQTLRAFLRSQGALEIRETQ